MNIPETLLNYIKSEIERLKYGKVTVEIVETSNKIDVVTEERQRFSKEKNEQTKF